MVVGGCSGTGRGGGVSSERWCAGQRLWATHCRVAEADEWLGRSVGVGKYRCAAEAKSIQT